MKPNTLLTIIAALESGSHPSDIAADLRVMAQNSMEADPVLMAEQVTLLKKCSKTLNELLEHKPLIEAFKGSGLYSDTLGNIRFELDAMVNREKTDVEKD